MPCESVLVCNFVFSELPKKGWKIHVTIESRCIKQLFEVFDLADLHLCFSVVEQRSAMAGDGPRISQTQSVFKNASGKKAMILSNVAFAQIIAWCFAHQLFLIYRHKKQNHTSTPTSFTFINMPTLSLRQPNSFCAQKQLWTVASSSKSVQTTKKVTVGKSRQAFTNY